MCLCLLDPFPLPEYLFFILFPHILILSKRMGYENGVTNRGISQSVSQRGFHEPSCVFRSVLGSVIDTEFSDRDSPSPPTPRHTHTHRFSVQGPLFKSISSLRPVIFIFK